MKLNVIASYENNPRDWAAINLDDNGRHISTDYTIRNRDGSKYFKRVLASEDFKKQNEDYFKYKILSYVIEEIDKCI